MRVLLLTPPMVQLNTPYPATAYLTGFLRERGFEVEQADPAIEWVLRDVQMVLVMSVNPGFGGQAFIPSAIEKIVQLRRMIDERGYSVEIEVDGGVKVDNIDIVVKAGANVIVSGSGVFGTNDYAATIAEMRRRAEAARG